MTHAPKDPIVWIEIPVSDIDKSAAFYGEVFGYDMKVTRNMGPSPMAVFPTQTPGTGVSGHLYEGASVKGGPTIHMVVPDSIQEARARLIKAGGTATDQEIQIPAGKYLYANDLDGNSIGLFQANG